MFANKDSEKGHTIRRVPNTQAEPLTIWHCDGECRAIVHRIKRVAGNEGGGSDDLDVLSWCGCGAVALFVRRHVGGSVVPLVLPNQRFVYGGEAFGKKGSQASGFCIGIVAMDRLLLFPAFAESSLGKISCRVTWVNELCTFYSDKLLLATT